MASKSPITLLNFFIFNSAICEKEGEEQKKIIYYYPESTDLNTKIKNIGLCEALIQFIENFTSKPCESLHTQKTRQIFLQPEKDFWLVISLGLPSQQRTRDGQLYVEYIDEVQDNVYQSVLLTSYRLFSLMKGTFQSILERSENNWDAVRRNAEQFFNWYLPTLKINDADLLDVFEGIRFLPLENFAFLKIQSFINTIEEKFSHIKYLVFLYSTQLVWSGLDQEDMRILYHYLAVNVIPSFVDLELKGGTHLPSRSSPFGSGTHFGRFMTGPKTLEDFAGLNSIPKIFLNGGGSGYYIILYRALNATLCLLMEEKLKLDMEFFRTLDSEIGLQLSNLASEIGEQYSKTAPMSTSDLYMYFNHMNLAEKTTMHTGMNRLGHATLPQEIMKLLADLNGDLCQFNDHGEIIGKTVGDCWVIGKKSGQREFYFVLQQKNANIMDVSEEMKKLYMAHFQNIFILD